MLNKSSRKAMILNILKKENGIPIRLMADQLEVSHMTVRRDVEELASNGTVKLIHGGVILSPRLAWGIEEHPYSLSEAETTQSDAKNRIGKQAAKLIEDSDSLIIDIGSTTEYLAANLPRDMDLTVIGFSLNIMNITAGMERVKSIFTGGVFHEKTLMFESWEGLKLIKRNRATKAFISAAGISLELGVTCRNSYERGSKSTAIATSAKNILLADSSKFGVISSNFFAEINQFDVLVTDTGLNESTCKQLEEQQIEVILA